MRYRLVPLMVADGGNRGLLVYGLNRDASKVLLCVLLQLRLLVAAQRHVFSMGHLVVMVPLNLMVASIVAMLWFKVAVTSCWMWLILLEPR